MKKGYILIYVLIIGAILFMIANHALNKSNLYFSENLEKSNSIKNFYNTEKFIYLLPQNKDFKNIIKKEIYDRGRLFPNTTDIPSFIGLYDNLKFQCAFSESKECFTNGSDIIDAFSSGEIHITSGFDLNDEGSDALFSITCANRKGNSVKKIKALYSVVNPALKKYINKTYNDCIYIGEDAANLFIKNLDSVYRNVIKEPYDYSNIKSVLCEGGIGSCRITAFLHPDCKGGEFKFNFIDSKIFLNTAETSEKADIYLTNKQDGINYSVFSGIITTNGDLYINENTDFYGIIILKGKIHIKPGKKFTVNGMALSSNDENDFSTSSFEMNTSFKDIFKYGYLFDIIFTLKLKNIHEVN